MRMSLWSWLPGPSKVGNGVLQYSSGAHGYSLATLSKKCQRMPSILLLKTAAGQVFGGFSPQGFVPTGDEMSGDGDCFLFSLLPVASKYEWTGVNRVFVRVDSQQ